MKAPTERELASFRKWKENPTPMAKFIFLYGCILWGIPAGALAYFISISMSGEAYNSAQLLVRVGVFMIAGILFGYFMYRAKVKRFEQIKDKL